MNSIHVENMRSPQSDRPVANQYIITDDEQGKIFQSYQSTIAVCTDDGQIDLDETYWDYSRTTLKYLKEFLGQTTSKRITSKKEIQAKIDSGEYKLADLNK